jgi:hypothetical protein
VRLVAALRRAASSPDGAARQVARASIGTADRVDAGLRRYAAANPAANELQPGSGG